MAVADVERLAELAVAPGDAGQPPLEGGDGKFGAAALDLRSEVEADRFRIGRRLRKTLAAQPRGELPPVGGIGALGVVGLRRAGVGLGGLRQRRQAAAEAPGGREQGRGVGAGSLGLKRRAFRLWALRAVPDASVRTALRVGWRAGVGRGGAAIGADRRGPGGGAWRGGLAPPVFRGLGAMARPPGLRCRARRGDGAQLRRGPRRGGAGELGRGRGGRPRRGVDPARSDASARFPGSAEERRFGSDGPGAWGAADRRPAPSEASRAGSAACESALRAAFSDASAVCGPSLRAPSGAVQERLRAGFPTVSHRLRARSESCPIRQPYRTSPHPRQAGRITAEYEMTKRRRRFTMPR